ncbi:MAG: diguanylate cyclase [Planctomycetia bacterium]|nr:diguanylate cyclase [Planctomycetia bacterium]
MPGALTVSEVLGSTLIAALALAGAFLLGWWVRRSVLARSDTADPGSELARLALKQLHHLASSVRADVDLHRSQVHAINEQLNSGAPTDQAAVNKSLQELLEANDRLQRQLAMTEEKLTDQAREIERHAAHARTDSLTATVNRGGFDSELARRLAEWERRDRPFCLLMLDVDHFKEFNDRNGHPVGDRILKEVAGALKATMRDMDVVARYGGDEFAIIMPDTLLTEARMAAERAQRCVETLEIPATGKKLRVTVSEGLAEVMPGDDAVSLIRRADDALYAAKQAGRNCAFVHDSQQCLPVTDLPLPQMASKTAAGSLAERPEFRSSEHPGQAIFLAELARRVAECQRTRAELAVLLLDVNGAEQLSSQFGSGPAGDIVAAVIEMLRSAAREMDMAMMVGPHRLAVILPGSSPAAAEQVAARVQNAVLHSNLPLGNSRLRLTISAGVACYLPNDDATSLYQRVAESIEAAVGNRPATEVAKLR